MLGVHALARGNASHDWKLLTVIAGGIFLLPPAFGQSFLWLAGSVNYLWCDALMVWLLLPFANAVFRDRPSPRAAAVSYTHLNPFTFPHKTGKRYRPAAFHQRFRP